MVAREINVIKVPRNGPLPDKPISFPKLENLHLDMMENKRKLKKNLPLITLKQPVQSSTKAAPKAAAYSTAIITGVAGAVVAATAAKSSAAAKQKEDFVAEEEDAKELEELEAPEPVKSKKKRSKKIEIEVPEEEDEVLEDLGADDADGDIGDADDDNGEPDEAGEDIGDAGGDQGSADQAEVPAEEDDPYAGMSPEERERNEKEEYIWRFKILKKKYKNRKEIADYNEHDDLFTMKQTYDRTLREIQLEDNCESYRMYLFGGFMLMEFVSNNWLDIDLTGFAAQQMLMQDKYDRMLIELGEKSYNRWGSNLPVEIRLIGFIILQAGIFYLGKVIAEKGGGAMADIFRMFTGVTPAATAANAAPVVPLDPDAPKKKMRGPSVKVADLKKKSET